MLDPKRVAVRVTDRGIGIPRGQLKRVFKRFYRVPRRVMSRISGNGLGLFIVRRVAEARVPLDGAEDARVVAFRAADAGTEHLAILVGQPDAADAPLDRLHS